MRISGFVSMGIALLALGGCGGGGSSAGVGSDGGSSFDTGFFHFEGSAMAAPQVTSSVGATVYVLTGNVTKAVMTDTSPTLAETEIVTSRNSNLGNQIVAMLPDGTSPRVIYTGTTSMINLMCSSTWVYFMEGTALKRVPLAGGSAVTLKASIHSFALTPDGTKLAYRNGTQYRLCNADGSSDILIVDDSVTNATLIGWLSPTQIAGFGSNTLYSLEAVAGKLWIGRDGLSASLKTAVDSASHRLVTVTASNIYTYTLNSNFLLNGITNTGIALSPRSVCISPDGSTIGLVLISGNDVAMTLPMDLTSTRTLPNDYSIFSMAWTPFITSRQFLPAGSFGTGAAAVLYSENGLKVPNVVLADATTRSSMVATKVSVDGATNTVYRLDCDQLTKLYYTKNNNYAQTSVVSSGTGLKGAYVSFDAASGLVASILTFTRQPSSRLSGKSLEISGEGLTYYSADGKQAKSNATRFQFD